MKQPKNNILTESFVHVAKTILCPKDPFSKEEWTFGFLLNNSRPLSESMMIHLIFKFQFDKTNSCKLFAFLQETDANPFLNQETKDEILTLFCRIQKIYRALNRLAFLYKFKKAPLRIATDLYLAPIEEHAKHVIGLYQNNQKFLFTRVDIIKIVCNSICHTSHFFSDPLPCKNPYNNILFTKNNLYNIYFFIRNSGCVMPAMIQNYYLSDFDLKKYQDDNIYLIREYAIDQYWKNLSEQESLYEMEGMLDMFNAACRYHRFKIKIPVEFPRDHLIHVFKPYLKLYVMYVYSNNHEKKIIVKNQLMSKLVAFSKHNHKFGRKVIKVNHIFKKPAIHFNDRHVAFYPDATSQQLRFYDSHTAVMDTIRNWGDINHLILSHRFGGIHTHFDDDDDHDHDFIPLRHNQDDTTSSEQEHYEEEEEDEDQDQDEEM